MKLGSFIHLGLWTGLVVCFCPLAVQAQDKLSIRPKEQWSTFFAEKEIVFHFQISAPQGFSGRASWTFAAENQRVFPRGRGEAAVKAPAKKTVEIKVPFTTPPLKPGVALAIKLTVVLTADGKNEPDALHEKVLWIFTADPFNDRKEWLKELKITLWDPDEKSKTAEAFKSLNIPHEAVPNVAALAAVKEGLVVVGEGASFKEETGLADALIQAAGRGLAVLCMAPADGHFPAPTARGLGPPKSVSLRRHDIITKLDKRLDAQAWAPDGKAAAGSLDLAVEEQSVVFQILAKEGGWLWLDVPYDKGRLLVCSFGIIRYWEASPTPRYLLARLFEQLAPVADKEAGKEKK
jgi:hypothetical protein